MFQFDLNPNPDVEVHKRDKRRGLRANRLCCVYERLWATSGIVETIIIVVLSSPSLSHPHLIFSDHNQSCNDHHRLRLLLLIAIIMIIMVFMVIMIFMIIIIVMIIMMIINSGCASSPVQPRVPQQVRRQVA